MDERAWLGRVPAMRWERHFGDRVVRCFVERPGNAYALLAEAAARNPDGEAIVCGDERLSYREFEARGGALRRRARGGRHRPGDRVAMLLGNGIAFPVVMFAALRLGADRGAALSMREQTQGLAYMLAHCGAKLLVHDAELADRLPRARRDAGARASRRGRAGRALDRACGCSRRASGAAPAAVAGGGHRRSSSTPRAPPGGRKAPMLTHLGICHSAMHYECCMGLTRTTARSSRCR